MVLEIWELVSRDTIDYGNGEIGFVIGENALKIVLSVIGIAKKAFANRIRGVEVVSFIS